MMGDREEGDQKADAGQTKGGGGPRGQTGFRWALNGLFSSVERLQGNGRQRQRPSVRSVRPLPTGLSKKLGPGPGFRFLRAPSPPTTPPLLSHNHFDHWSPSFLRLVHHSIHLRNDLCRRGRSSLRTRALLWGLLYIHTTGYRYSSLSTVQIQSVHSRSLCS